MNIVNEVVEINRKVYYKRQMCCDGFCEDALCQVSLKSAFSMHIRPNVSTFSEAGRAGMLFVRISDLVTSDVLSCIVLLMDNSLSDLLPKVHD